MRRRKLRGDGPPVPPRVKSLIGCRFGRLIVQHYAGQDKHGKSYWCCLCDCGTLCRVPGGRLLGTTSKERGHPQVSCGCARADPDIRRAARLKVPAKRRADICDRARASVKSHSPTYSMDAHRAAEILGCSLEHVEIMAKDGTLRHTYRRGALWVSSADVSGMVAVQARNKKHCRAIEEWELTAKGGLPVGPIPDLEKRAVIAEMFSAGIPVAEIARRFAISRQRVYQILDAREGQ